MLALTRSRRALGRSDVGTFIRPTMVEREVGEQNKLTDMCTCVFMLADATLRPAPASVTLYPMRMPTQDCPNNIGLAAR
jgi:hypothetical protein